MDLLKRSELPTWLLQRFGSASSLAEALGVTRQTAHNLITGRTMPSYETCERLGLDPVFMLRERRDSGSMDSLDSFLSKRNELAQSSVLAQRNAQMLRGHSSQMWSELQQATVSRASLVGSVDGVALDWSQSQFLSLQPVAAIFASGAMVNQVPQHFRIIFGRIPYAVYVDDKAPASDVWEINLTLVGSDLRWDVNGGELIGLTSSNLAEQVIKRLIQYRDAYQAYYSPGAWLT